MEIEITPVVLFVLGLLFGLLSEGVRWIGRQFSRLKTQVPPEWDWAVDELVTIGVRAAEQIWRGHEDNAKNKLDFAYNYVVTELKQRGLKIDEGLIRARIEAKVFELFNEQKAN
jgi:hypothetical protein